MASSVETEIQTSPMSGFGMFLLSFGVVVVSGIIILTLVALGMSALLTN